MRDTHKQWNSGSKDWGVTFCGTGTWNVELSDEPTCEKCKQEMARERFRAHNHEVLKSETTEYRTGQRRFVIIERRKHNFIHRDDTVAEFEKKEDRDNIYEAMRLGGYCGHSTKSWIRSIPPPERPRWMPPNMKHWGLLR